MTPPSARNTTLALLAAREAVPDLQVVIKPHLHGDDAVVDHCCHTIYLSARLTVEQHGDALVAALAALVGAARRAPAVPSPRTEHTTRWQQTG